MSDVGGEIAENCGFEGKILCEVPQPCAPCDSRDACDTTTSEQLAEIEGQAESTPVTGYTPPEGWRVVQVGEVLRDGDLWVNHEGELWPTKRVGERVNDERYIRRIQVREGRWRTRSGDIRNVTPTPEGDGRKERFPWWDAAYQGTWTSDGRYLFGEASPLDLEEYLGPIEEQPEPEPQPPMLQDADQMIKLLSEANHNHVAMIGRLQGRINDLETIRDNQAATIEELRSEVSYVQRLLGESRQRVTQLEELVTSLRTINEAQEKSFSAANKANDDLQHRLNVVSAEWAEQTERFRRLQQANDKLAQLEALQPIAAACHTAQTMVRDMLGHMRCLLALQHTTDRRNFCTLLESILEVFDEAECDEDEDDDTTCTTNTSEAGQG